MNIADLGSISWGLCTGFSAGYAVVCFTGKAPQGYWRFVAGAAATIAVLLSAAVHI